MYRDIAGKTELVGSWRKIRDPEGKVAIKTFQPSEIVEKPTKEPEIVTTTVTTTAPGATVTPITEAEKAGITGAFPWTIPTGEEITKGIQEAVDKLLGKGPKEMSTTTTVVTTTERTPAPLPPSTSCSYWCE